MYHSTATLLSLQIFGEDAHFPRQPEHATLSWYAFQAGFSSMATLEQRVSITPLKATAKCAKSNGTIFR